MTIAVQNKKQEEGIKALLKSIQKKRKSQGERINNQADIIYLALQELEEKIRWI
jgi:hypothetical protein